MEGSVLVRCPVEQVFDLVADERAEPAYNPAMATAVKVTDGPIGVGTRFRATLRTRPRPMPLDVEYTGFDRPARIASTTRTPGAEITGAVTFTPVPAGTLLHWAWDARLRGAARVLTPVLALAGNRRERRVWTALRDSLEGVPRSPRRPLLGLRRRPGRLAAAFFRLPLLAYRHGVGPAVGSTFLAFTHLGRRTGQEHQTVALVLAHDPASGEAVIAAAWGPQTDWYRNLQAAPAVQVQLGGRAFAPQQRFLTEEEAGAVVRAFRRAHPHRARLIGVVLGWGDLRDDQRLDDVVRTHPFVAFRPAGAPSASPAG